MTSKAIRTCIFSTLIAVLIFTAGVLLGGYRGYNYGYHEGQKVTNTWWIDKQSRYYDSVEVQKKRYSQKYDFL
jgi:membrane protein DedA with SNARE-associated domain